MHEYSDAGDHGTRMMTGFMMGALVGAGIALLLAPATGEETRRRLRETAGRLRDDAEGAVENVRERFNEMRHGSEERAEEGSTSGFGATQGQSQTKGARTGTTNPGQPQTAPGGRPA